MPVDSDEELLAAAVRALRRRSNAALTFGGRVQHGALRLTQLVGARTSLLRDLAIRPAAGAGGRSWSEQRPVAVADYRHDRTITHDYDRPVLAEGITAVVAVPVVARGETRAVLYAADRSSTGVGNTARAAAAEAAAALAREFEVRDEVERRLQVVRDHPAPTDADLVERVRLAHAELRALARTVPDAALRERLAAVDALLGGTAPAPAVRLSPRELDVLSLVALGCSYREVGERLFLGAQSVKTYMRNVLAKLDAHSRYEAVVVARRLQLIP